MNQRPPLVVISASDDPQDFEYCHRLARQLKPLLDQQQLRLWHHGMADLGDPRKTADIRRSHMKQASMVLLLLSPSYLEKCEAEMRYALSLPSARVVGIIAVPCLYDSLDIAQHTILIPGGRAISQHANMEEALHDVAVGVRGLVLKSSASSAQDKEMERRYLEALSRKIQQIESGVRASSHIQQSGHTRRRARASWLNRLPFNWQARTFHRHSISDYGTNPALGDLELSVRAGFGKRVKIRDLAKELRKYRCIVVLGEPGSGKTVCLRQLALDLAQGELQRPGQPRMLPLLIGMGAYEGWANKEEGRPQRVRDYIEQSTRDLFKHEIAQGGDDHPVVQILACLDEFLRQGRVVCIFDALDEMSPMGYQERYQGLKGFMNTWLLRPGNRFVFSCRQLDYDASFNVDEVLIDPFSRRQIRGYLQKHLKEETWPEIYRRIEDDDALYEMVCNPFLLHALVYVNQDLPTPEIPTVRGQLMRRFVGALLQREAEQKQQESLAHAGGLTLLQRFLADLGYYMQRLARGTLARTEDLKHLWTEYPSWQELLRIARRARILGKRCEDPDDVLGGPVVVDRVPEQIEFVHHRLQEFFAAQALARHLEAVLDDEVAGLLENIWWQETVILAMGIVDSPGPILQRLLKPQPDVSKWSERVAAQAESLTSLCKVEAENAPK